MGVEKRRSLANTVRFLRRITSIWTWKVRTKVRNVALLDSSLRKEKGETARAGASRLTSMPSARMQEHT